MKRNPTARRHLRGASAAALLFAGAFAVAALVAMPSCKSDDARPDVGLILPDAALGATCDAEPNHWQVADHGIKARDDAGSRANLFSVWGASANEIWAVGSEGTVLFYDGKTWTRQQTPTTELLTSVWGTSAKDVFAVGFGGTVLRFQGTSWTKVPVPDEVFLERIPDAGVPTGDAAVAVRRNLWGVWASVNNEITQDVYAVGDRGTVIHFDAPNGIWTRVDSGVEEKLSGIWGRNASKVYIVGGFGTVLTGTKNGLTKEQTGISKELRAVWGRSNNNVYAVGLGGAVLYYDGSKWRSVEGAPPQVLRGVWGPSNDNSTTFMIGWDGVLLQMKGNPPFNNGATFNAFNCVTPNRLEAIWGTLVNGPWPDAGPPDIGPSDGGPTDLPFPQIPAIWIVGVGETIINGP